MGDRAGTLFRVGDKTTEDEGPASAVLRSYLRILLGGRNYEVLGEAMGVGSKGAGHILNGRRKVSEDHLDAICRTWHVPPREMFATIARIALNRELGLPDDDGLDDLKRRPYGPAASEGDGAPPTRE